MAIYHLSTKPISRSSGRSATASIAYRVGIAIEDKRQGKTYDYTKRNGVLHSELLTPHNISVSRNDLWNMAELAEKRSNSRTAREFVVNIPHELMDNPNDLNSKGISAIRDLAQTLKNQYGVAVDFAIHSPDKQGDNRNYHAHIMVTTRQLTVDKDGSAILGDKSQLEMSNTQLKAIGKATAQDELKQIREKWATIANKHLEQAGIAERIDHRSNKDRGLETLPTVKMGWEVTELERQGIRTTKGDINREIKAYNEKIIGLSADYKELAQLEKQKAEQVPTEQPKEIKKQIEVTAVTELLPTSPTPKNDWIERAKQRKAEQAPQKTRTSIQSPNKPIETSKNEEVISPPPAPEKSLQTQNTHHSEPNILDINQKTNLIKDYAEKVHTTAKAILYSQLKALREKAKPILEKYNTLKDSKPLIFGKDQWEKEKNTTLNAYNAVKTTHDIMKDKGVTDEHYKRAREHIAKNEPSYYDKVQQAIKDIESYHQDKQDKTARENGADFHAKKGVTYSGEIMRADEKGVIQKTRDGLVYHPHSLLDVKEGKEYNICNEGDHYTTQPIMEIRTSVKSQEKDIQR